MVTSERYTPYFHHGEHETEAVRLKVGLQVLQTADPDIIQVLNRAMFVAAYALDSNNAWARADIEGALYVVKRASEPKYRLIILNQRNPHNLVENITEHWELNHEAQFIFYRILNENNGPNKSDTSRVAGLWFSDLRESRAVLEGLETILSGFHRDNSKDSCSSNHHKHSNVSSEDKEDYEQLQIDSIHVSNGIGESQTSNFHNHPSVPSQPYESHQVKASITPPLQKLVDKYRHRHSELNWGNSTDQLQNRQSGGKKAGAAILSLIGVSKSESSTHVSYTSQQFSPRSNDRQYSDSKNTAIKPPGIIPAKWSHPHIDVKPSTTKWSSSRSVQSSKKELSHGLSSSTKATSRRKKPLSQERSHRQDNDLHSKRITHTFQQNSQQVCKVCNSLNAAAHSVEKAKEDADSCDETYGWPEMSSAIGDGNHGRKAYNHSEENEQLNRRSADERKHGHSIDPHTVEIMYDCFVSSLRNPVVKGAIVTHILSTLD